MYTQEESVEAIIRAIEEAVKVEATVGAARLHYPLTELVLAHTSCENLLTVPRGIFVT